MRRSPSAPAAHVVRDDAAGHTGVGVRRPVQRGGHARRRRSDRPARRRGAALPRRREHRRRRDRRARRQRGQRHRGVLGRRTTARRSTGRSLPSTNSSPGTPPTTTTTSLLRGRRARPRQRRLLLRREHHRLGSRRAAAAAARRQRRHGGDHGARPRVRPLRRSYQAGLLAEETPTLVGEQQADCLAGVYMRWVAEGKSPRFTLSTGDGLNNLLAAMIAFRDPLLTESDGELGEDEHGSAFERVSAFQFGFTDGAAVVRGDRPRGDQAAARRPSRAAARRPDRRAAGHRAVGARRSSTR